MMMMMMVLFFGATVYFYILPNSPTREPRITHSADSYAFGNCDELFSSRSSFGDDGAAPHQPTTRPVSVWLGPPGLLLLPFAVPIQPTNRPNGVPL